MIHVRTARMRLREASEMASGAAARLLEIDQRADAARWAIRAGDALADFVDSGAIADLQGAAAFALLALSRALAGSAAPPAETAKIGQLVAHEAVEVIDAELQKLDRAIASPGDDASKRVLRTRRDNVRAERAKIVSALEAQVEKGE